MVLPDRGTEIYFGNKRVGTIRANHSALMHVQGMFINPTIYPPSKISTISPHSKSHQAKWREATTHWNMGKLYDVDNCGLALVLTSLENLWLKSWLHSLIQLAQPQHANLRCGDQHRQHRKPGINYYWSIGPPVIEVAGYGKRKSLGMGKFCMQALMTQVQVIIETIF